MRILRSIGIRLWLLSRLGWYLLVMFGVTVAPAIAVWRVARPAGGLIPATLLAVAACGVGPLILHGMGAAELPRHETRGVVWGFTLIGAVVLLWLVLS
jgi:hypothetical protein